MVETQTDDGGEGQHEEQIEGASDWLLACTRGDWGPDSSPLFDQARIELERALPLPCRL